MNARGVALDQDGAPRQGARQPVRQHPCRRRLIESANYAYLAHGFYWASAFPGIMKEEGGFDVVLGNPPYVRMEHLKPLKPFLEKRYEVVSDRADLYAYFYERGLRLLKPGGRLGYISSSTFFKTGSGRPLRKYLLRDRPSVRRDRPDRRHRLRPVRVDARRNRVARSVRVDGCRAGGRPVGESDRPYGREQACYPPGAFRVDKWRAPVDRVDDA
jgi:hypothetical protein